MTFPVLLSSFSYLLKIEFRNKQKCYLPALVGPYCGKLYPLSRVRPEAWVETELRKADRTVGVNCYTFSSISQARPDFFRECLQLRKDKMATCCQPKSTRCVPHEKFPRNPYHDSFIDYACSVKMAGYWRSFFASLWTSTPSRP